MAVSYRSYFRVVGETDIAGIARQQVYSWQHSKGWDGHDLVEGDSIRLAERVWGTLLTEETQDGARSERYHFVEDGDGGVWTTDVTVHVDREGDTGWVWIEIDSPERFNAKPPRLATNLLDVLPAYDGESELGRWPAPARLDDVDAVVRVLLDSDRRGLVFVAATSHQLPVADWRNHVGKLLRDTAGTAIEIVLDANATEEFNARVPDGYRVFPGTVRTFVPGVDFENELEAPRHRILSTRRIVSDRLDALRSLLGRRARQVSLDTPVPKTALKVDRRLRSQLDELLVGDFHPPIVTLPIPDVVGEDSVEAESPATTEPLRPTPGTDDHHPLPAAEPAHTEDEEAGWRSALTRLLDSTLGVRRISADTIARLGESIQRATRQSRSAEGLAARLRSLETRADSDSERINDLQRQLEDERLERALADTDRVAAEKNLRALRLELAQLGHGEVAWSEPDDDPRDVRPDGFDDLLGRLSELDRVVFTGNEGHARALDDHDPLGVWAGKCWEAVLALQDYADLRSGDASIGGVDLYLANTPPGRRGYSRNRHASTESETVRSTPKLHRPRLLPVPTGVTGDGKVHMWAHFKIANSATISPRMHYYDDVAGTGKIYVGYIGRHLPTTANV